MKFKTSIVVILLSLLLAGCVPESTEPSTFTTAPTSVPVETTQPEQTVPVTETTVPETTCETIPTVPTIPALSTPAGSYKLKFEDIENDTYMEYFAFIPENATENMPLIIFLHGDGEVGRIDSLENNSLMVSVREIYGNEFPFIVISPCTRVKSWIDWTIPGTLKNLIDDVVLTYHIDPEHVIITGHSRGAVSVWYMANTHSEYFSAAVPVSCYAWTALDEDKITQIPIRAFCGNVEDFERQYSYSMQDQINKIYSWGGDAEFTLHDGARHYQTPGLSYTPELFQWMLEQ